MAYQHMFRKDLIAFHWTAADETQLFKQAAKELLAKGLVKDSYLAGLMDREAAFPTGLITKYLNIALPHCDTVHIETPFVYVVRLEESVTVKQMGDNQRMEAQDFFFLGIKDPAEQVGLLQALMDLFMQEEFVVQYKQMDNAEQVYQLIMENLNN